MAKTTFNIGQSRQIATGYNPIQPIVPFQRHAIVTQGDDTINVQKTNIAKDNNGGVISENFFVSDPNAYVCPVTFVLPVKGTAYTFPIEPLVSVSGKNNIVRRYVAKSHRHGSIKELWSQDDYTITIGGVLTVDSQFCELKDMIECCMAEESIKMICPYTQEAFGITHIAIESYDFPFTKGTENYQFTIKGYSDEAYSLLEEL
ncbi:MAG: hypothetical protein IKI25_10915 [Bacteroidales bacterium]|nr:hypothetical protein [Bacteroidales bacterium]